MMRARDRRASLALALALVLALAAAPDAALAQTSRGSVGRGGGGGGGGPRAATARTSYPTTRGAAAARGGPRVRAPTPTPTTVSRTPAPTTRGGPRAVRTTPTPTPRATTTTTTRGAPRTVQQQPSTTTTTTREQPVPRPSTTRAPETILNRQQGQIDDLTQRLESLRRDRGDVVNDYFDGGVVDGYRAGFADGFYDDYGGFGGFGGFGVGVTFPDPCCLSGFATSSAYCNVGWGGGVGLGNVGGVVSGVGGLFNLPCCVDGGPYVCTQAAVLAQSYEQRTYPEPCCDTGYAIRGETCGDRFDAASGAEFPCCVAGGAWTCAGPKTTEAQREVTGFESATQPQPPLREVQRPS